MTVLCGNVLVVKAGFFEILKCVKLDEFVPCIDWHWFYASTKIRRQNGGFDGMLCHNELYDECPQKRDKWLVVEITSQTVTSFDLQLPDHEIESRIEVAVDGDDGLLSFIYRIK
mgnify:CR=1 FL=1